MFEKPPPEANRATATSESVETSAPEGRNVAPTVVIYGHVAGKAGL
jgi:hypothetical protein